MNSIYDAKVRAFKNNEMANLNNDKWNPGDIWMTTMTPGSDPLAMFKQDWGILNLLNTKRSYSQPWTLMLLHSP